GGPRCAAVPPRLPALAAPNATVVCVTFCPCFPRANVSRNFSKAAAPPRPGLAPSKKFLGLPPPSRYCQPDFILMQRVWVATLSVAFAVQRRKLRLGGCPGEHGFTQFLQRRAAFVPRLLHFTQLARKGVTFTGQREDRSLHRQWTACHQYFPTQHRISS